MMPFPGEAAVMMVCEGHPPRGRRHASNLSPWTLTYCGLGHKDTRM
jgi:hypothetical protein